MCELSRKTITPNLKGDKIMNGKFLRKIIATVMTVSLVMSVSIVGYSKSTNTSTTEKPTKLRIYRVAVEQDPTKDRMLLELQKRTNTQIEFVTAPWDQDATKIMTLLSGGDDIDLMSIDPTTVDYTSFAKNGLLLQLDDLLKTNKYPIEKKLAYGDIYFKKLNIDKKIYGIPEPIQPGDWNVIIRTDWLKNVGLKMPKTPEDMHEVLKRFKNNDPDKNGKNDTIGMTVSDGLGQMGPLFNMFMFYQMPFDLINGKIVYNYSSPKYAKALKYINNLYNEGLLNKDFATIKDRNYVENQFEAARCGITNSQMITRTLSALKQNVPKATIGLLNPVPHDSGTNGATAVDSKWNWMVSVIPKTCKNPEKVMEFLEYCNSDEGRKLMCTGIQGVHYQSYKDGVFYGINAAEQAKDWDPAKAEGPTGSPMWWGVTNTINGIIPYNKYASLAEALKNVTTFVSAEDKKSNPYYDMRKLGSLVTYHDPVPIAIPELMSINGALGSIKQEYEVKIILSSPKDFDKLWKEYVKALDGAGLQNAVAAAQKWYNANK